MPDIIMPDIMYAYIVMTVIVTTLLWTPLGPKKLVLITEVSKVDLYKKTQLLGVTSEAVEVSLFQGCPLRDIPTYVRMHVLEVFPTYQTQVLYMSCIHKAYIPIGSTDQSSTYTKHKEAWVAGEGFQGRDKLSPVGVSRVRRRGWRTRGEVDGGK